jgi:5'/3'-nucleotidase SurE
MRRQTTHLFSLLLVLILFSPALGHGQGRPLKILLTNDDGFDAAGLVVMRRALMAAGHQVTVVAPAENQSSTSMSMTSGTLKVENKGDGVWAVHGTPADSALIGLAHVLRDTPQDLVVSGTNAGANLGNSANGSGTVGAAITAARFGVPAIAASAGLGADAGRAYDMAAVLVTQMIASLVTSAPVGGGFLPKGMVINLNVPAVPADKVLGIRWAPLSSRSAYRPVYTAGETTSEVRSRLTLSTDPLDEKDTDLALFNQGWVTLTLLDGDLGALAPAGAAVASRLSKLALPETKR